MRRLQFWHYGLIGGAVLSIATLRKAVGALPFVRSADVDDAGWADVLLFGLGVFAMGSVCGLVVWAGRGLHRRIGWAGDAVVGVGVMLLFFLCCMLLFDPEMLTTNWRAGGVPMFSLAAAIGAVAGPWIGRDWRKEFGNTPGDVAERLNGDR